MRIEEAEALERMISGKWIGSEVPIHRAITALRAEAWHPIEKAEEMGAKDGRYVLVWAIDEFWDVRWDGKYWTNSDSDASIFEYSPTHFRFINPPEGV